MVSEIVGVSVGVPLGITDVLHELYESECDAVRLEQMKVIAEHTYRVSGDTDILMEGLSDIGHGIIEWFKKMATIIREFFSKFIKIFTDFALSLDAFVEKNRDALLKSEINTTITGFRFTVLDKPDPNMSEMDKLIASYNSMLNGIDSLELSEVRKQSVDFLSDVNMGKIRGEVLGSKNAIESDIFLKEVRKFYRDNMESPGNIKVDNSYINEIVSHAKKLVDAKSKATNDRDRILKLLKSAESFFNSRVVIGYDNRAATIKTRTISSSSTSDKFDTADGDTLQYDKYYKKYSGLMVAKYNEIKELSKIISVVVTERANAFKDQVKQERKIVSMAMKPIVSKSAEESTFYNEIVQGNYDEDTEEATNYEIIGNEYDFVNGPVVENAELRNLHRETSWYNDVLQGNYNQVAMEGVISTLANTLQGFILKITGMFRGKAKGMTKKYGPWIKDDGVIEQIKGNARKMSLDLVDHWSADYRRDLTLIEDAFNRVFQETNDLTKCVFAANFIKETNIENIKKFGDNGRDLTNIMRNYFRCGKPGIDKLDKVTLAGTELEKQITKMIDYVADYSKFAETLVTIEGKAKNLKVPVGESTSLWFDSYLNIEGCTVAESSLGMILPIMPGFDYVMEADTKEPDANASAKQVVNNAVKNAPDDKTTKNATQVVNNTNKDVETAAGDVGKGKAGEGRKEYYSFTCDFLKKLVSSYCTVCEERAVLYINVLKNCAGPEYRPVFRNGEYIKKSIRVKDEGRTVEVDVNDQGNNDNAAKGKAKKPGVMSKIKNAVVKNKKAMAESTDISSVYEKPTIGLNWMD